MFAVVHLLAFAQSPRAEEDVLAYKTIPQAFWRQIHFQNPLERLNKEIKRRTNVVGIFPDRAPR